MIYVLGGSNMDIYGIPSHVMKSHDSNIGHVRMEHGGVARNIVESLARLQIPICFMSAFGDDAFGKELLAKLNDLHVNTSHSLVLKNKQTATYMAMLDENGDMDMAICDNEIIFQIEPWQVDKFLENCTKDDYLVMDTNLDEKLIHYVMTHTKAKICVDPLSCAKAVKLQGCLDKIYAIKPNRLEASVLANMPIETEEDVCRAGDYFLSQGIQHIYISLGEKGMYYQTKNERYFVETTPVPMVNATGAGDACMAAIVYGLAKEFSKEDIVEYAMSNSIATIGVASTVNHDLSFDLLKKIKNEHEFKWRKETC